MREKVALITIACLSLLLIPSPANAAMVTSNIDKSFSMKVSDVVKLPKSGCSSLKVQYTVSKSLRYPDYFVSISLENKSGASLGNVVVEPGSKGSFGGGDPYKGVKSLRLCRAAWVDEEDNRYLGAKNGTYTLSATLWETRTLETSDSRGIKITIK